MNRFLLLMVPCLLLSRPSPLGGKEICLVLLQKQEATRRAAFPSSRLAVDDRNMDSLTLPGVNYHFTQLVVDPPPTMAGGESSLTPISDRAARNRRADELERSIAEAEANVNNYENQYHDIELDLAPYRIWDKEGFIREKRAELQRWIDGERLYIHYTKKKLEKLFE